MDYKFLKAVLYSELSNLVADLTQKSMNAAVIDVVTHQPAT